MTCSCRCSGLLRPEEGQSIWSKRRQGFQPCFEAGIRELPFLTSMYCITNYSDSPNSNTVVNQKYPQKFMYRQCCMRNRQEQLCTVYGTSHKPLTLFHGWTGHSIHRSYYCFAPLTSFRSLPSFIVLHFLLQDAVSAESLGSLKLPALKVSEVYISGESIT